MKWFGAGVSSLTITEASARAENHSSKFIVSGMIQSLNSKLKNIQLEQQNICLKTILNN
jgi:hypothetical protein